MQKDLHERSAEPGGDHAAGLTGMSEPRCLPELQKIGSYSGKAVSKTRKSKKGVSAKVKPSSRRTWVVMTCLFGMLLSTGALLKVLDPGPLTQDASSSLFAIGDQTIDRVFETNVPLRAAHWKSIYVHQSLTSGGDAMSLGRGQAGLADHFVIGNGSGCADGEIQIGRRWSQQLPSGLSDAARNDSISICLVGDFNHNHPTATQEARLAQLVTALQHQFRISSEHVLLATRRNAGVLGAGTNFPVAELRSQLMP